MKRRPPNDRTTLQRVSRRLLPFACLALAGAIRPAEGQTVRWWNTAAGEWSLTGNWDPADAAPADGDSVTFGATGSGGINTNDIGSLTLNTFRVIEGEHTTDLGGHAITTTTFVVEGFTDAVTGIVHIVNSGALVVGTAMHLGYGAYADAHLRLASDVGLQIGSPTVRAAILRVAENTGGSPSHGHASLTAGAQFSAWLADLSVGHRNTGYTLGSTYGLLDLSTVTESGILDISGNVRIGVDRFASGEVIVSDAVDVRIGSPGARGGFLRVTDIANSPGTPPSQLILGTGRFDAYVTDLVVGAGDGDGVIDAGRVAAGILDISGNLYVNHDRAGIGRLTVSDGLPLTIGDPAARGSLIIGGTANNSQGYFTAGTNRFEAYLNQLDVATGGGSSGAIGELNLHRVTDGLLDIAGNVRIGGIRKSVTTVTLSSGFVTRIGDPATRVTLTQGDADRWETLTFTAGGSFSAYLDNLIVGRRTTTFTLAGHALLDLSAVTNGVLDVANDMIVCAGLSDGRATVKLPAIPAAAGTLTVGDTTHAGAYGRLELDGTVMTVTHAVLLTGSAADNVGRIDVTLSTAPAGLDLVETATLTIGQGVLHLIFRQPPGDRPPAHYWGLRWQGDHTAALTATNAAGKLTWDDSALTRYVIEPVRVYLHEGATYVGARLGRRGMLMVLR